LIKIYDVRAAKGCYNPAWEFHKNTHSTGSSVVSGVRKLTECVDYCGNEVKCVGIDFNYLLRKCWAHLSQDAFLPQNIVKKLTTNQYRMIKRCSPDPSPGFSRLIVCRLVW